MDRSRSVRQFLVIVAAGAAITLSGCTGTADLKQASDTLAAQQAYLSEQKATAQTQLAEAQATGNTAAAATATKTIQTVDKIQPELAKAQTVIVAASNADGSPNPVAAIQAAAAFLPPPYGTIAGFAAIGLAGLFSEYKRQQAVKAAASIVNSLDVLRIADPAVAASMSKNKLAMQAQLTPAAKNLVDAERLNA